MTNKEVLERLADGSRVTATERNVIVRALRMLPASTLDDEAIALDPQPSLRPLRAHPWRQNKAVAARAR